MAAASCLKARTNRQSPAPSRFPSHIWTIDQPRMERSLFFAEGGSFALALPAHNRLQNPQVKFAMIPRQSPSGESQSANDLRPDIGTNQASLKAPALIPCCFESHSLFRQLLEPDLLPLYNSTLPDGIIHVHPFL